MAALEFGIFDAFPKERPDETPAELYDRHIARSQLAERVGFGYYFFIEHQNAPFADISAPNVYLAALARETTRLRFGPLVYQMPTHHPIRLAQDAAMVDQLSHGRLEFGIGYGIHAHEFMRWKLPFGERRKMGVEMMEIILKAWTEDSVTYEGQYWTFDEALPRPPPYQKPHPPLWLGAHSKDSLDYAAKMNLNVAQNIDVDSVVTEKFAYFRDAWRRAGHAGPQPRTLLARHCHVAPTDEQARAEAEPLLLKGFFGAGAEGIAKTRIGWGGDPRGTGGERNADIDERGRVFQEIVKSYDFWIDNGLALVGSPETVIRRIQEQQARVGYDVLSTTHQIHDMPSALVDASIRLFGEEVLPAFR
ncbi:MAG TPA: LLM class flavin-dependent oxidoreductase [Chloroflexota bacterium]|jgi:alkanesulfonate monooxygenase SsuD/methylene tetrahydromethanopterin reductase-like flavin-dependent oxidoreductase (luciferase family)